MNAECPLYETCGLLHNNLNNLTQNITTLLGLSPLSPHSVSGEEGSIYQMTQVKLH